MYRTKPDIWHQIQSLLPSDDSIDRRLRELRNNLIGNVPETRDGLDIKNLLENLQEFGSDNIEVLDSLKMWQDEEFRKNIDNDFSLDDPPRVLLLTTPKMLEQLANSAKWSQDGTHRISPGQFAQVFITMMKVGEKWLPAVKGLLPDHTERSYRLQNKMIKHAIEKLGLQIKVSSIMSDYEVGIQKALQEVFPMAEIRGCRFHFAQVSVLYINSKYVVSNLSSFQILCHIRCMDSLMYTIYLLIYITLSVFVMSVESVMLFCNDIDYIYPSNLYFVIYYGNIYIVIT